MSFQPSPSPSPAPSPGRWPTSYGCGGSFAGHVRVNLVVLAVLVGIWAFTGADYFWPAWAALGMAAGLAVKAVVFRTVAHRRDRRSHDEPSVSAASRPDDV